MTVRWMKSKSRQGFTVVELAFVLTVVMVLISLLLPAVQSVREKARVAQCQNNLLQLGVALHNYSLAHRVLPSGSVNATGAVTNKRPGYKMSWLVQILPQMGELSTWRQVDFVEPKASFAKEKELQLENLIGGGFGFGGGSDQLSDELDDRQETVEPEVIRLGIVFTWAICPSSPAPNGGMSFYAGCYSSRREPIDTNCDGLLYLNSSEALDDIPDGASVTLLVSEKAPMMNDNGWMAGDFSTLRSSAIGISQNYGNRPPSQTIEEDEQDAFANAGFTTPHPQSINVLMADGSVRRLGSDIDADLLRRLGSRNDGTLISEVEF